MLFLTCKVDILSVPVASVEDVFKVFVDLDTLELESGVMDNGFALEKFRFKLSTLSSKGRCADPFASADLA